MENRLPTSVLTWARQQTQSGVRFTTGDALWQAAAATFPGVLPSDAWPWPLMRDLLQAYVSGLAPLQVGDLVRLPARPEYAGCRATVTAIGGPNLLRVRVDHGPMGRRVPIDIGRIAVEPIPHIYYSATIITLDGSDTNAYGEPCEPGRGYTEATGWWNPDRAYWRLVEQRSATTADLYPDGEGRNPAQWLADQLTARLGPISSHERHTFHSAHEAVHPGQLTDFAEDPTAANPHWGHTMAAIRARLATQRQRRLTAAGHAHGFTHTQLAEAADLLGLT